MKRRILFPFCLMLSLVLCGGAFTACGETHEHIYGDWVEVTAAKCETNGLKKRVCTVAGCNSEETAEIPALDHSWGPSKVKIPATCTTQGVREKTCRRAGCGATKEEKTDLLDHDWVTLSVEEPATCTEPGLELQECSMCKEPREYTVPALDHNWGVPVIVKPATCTEPGIEHKTCTRCSTQSDDEEIPALEHQWKNTRVIKPATCEDDGEQEQTCQRTGCGKTQKVPLPALDHSWQEYFTVDVSPTFETEGSKSHHCNRCTKTKDVTEIPKLEANTPIAYEFRTVRNNGQLLRAPGMTVVVKDFETGTEVARSSPSEIASGVYTKELLPKTYTVTVENPPEGYTCGENLTVTYSDPYCNVYLTASVREGTPTRNYMVGDVMYDFTVPASSSTAGAIKLSDILQTKKMVFLNFWYEGCTYCEEEFPALNRAYVAYRDTVEVIGVNCPQSGQTGSLAEITDYGKKQGLTFPLVREAAVGLRGPFGVLNYPTSVIIDGEGVICEIFEGAHDLAEFTAFFEKYTADSYFVAGTH